MILFRRTVLYDYYFLLVIHDKIWRTRVALHLAVVLQQHLPGHRNDVLVVAVCHYKCHFQAQRQGRMDATANLQIVAIITVAITIQN